jgi:hypothetical protein
MNKDKASYVIDEIQRINDNINSMIVDGSICLNDYSSETLRGIDKLSSDSKELREFIMNSPDSFIIQRLTNLNYTNIIKFHELSPGYLKYEYILQLSEFIDNIKDIKDFMKTYHKKLYDTPITNDIFDKLYNEYFDIDYNTLCYFINNKKLPDGKDKYLWKGKAVDAVRFGDYFKIKISEMNRAFYIETTKGNKRELKNNDRKNTTSSKLTDILNLNRHE